MLEGFDPDDRKFIAVACAHPEKPPILQAVDSQWLDFRDALRENGVTVAFICEDDIQRLVEKLRIFCKVCISNNEDGIIYVKKKKIPLQINEGRS